MTGDQLDLDDQIVDKDWAREAIAKWMEIANVRQMHSGNMPPAGKGLSVEEKDDGFYLRAKIVEPLAIKLIEEGVYTGYSVGIKRPVIVSDPRARGGRIKGGLLVETSVVDYPCLPSAKMAPEDRAETVTKYMIAKVAGQTRRLIGRCQIEESACQCDGITATSGCRCSCVMCVASRDITKSATNDEALADEPVAIWKGAYWLPAADPQSDTDQLPFGIFPRPLFKREYSTDERLAMAGQGQAMPDGSFPTKDREDLQNDIASIGRATEYGKARSHTIRRAKALGATDMLPADWPGSTKNKGVAMGERTQKDMPGAAAAEAETIGQHAADEDGHKPSTEGGEAQGHVAQAPGEAVRKDADPKKPPVKDDDGDNDNDQAGDGQDDDADDDAKKSETPTLASLSLDEKRSAALYCLKRLHDLLCPAHDMASVLFTYPELAKNGVAAAMGPSVRSMIFTLLEAEIQEDAGFGYEAGDIHDLASAYKHLCSYMDGEMLDQYLEQVIDGGQFDFMSAHAEMRKAFQEQFPTIHISPQAPPKPSDFAMGILTAGHQTYDHPGSTSAPVSGSHTPKHTPDAPKASDFEHDALSAGHQAAAAVQKDTDEARLTAGTGSQHFDAAALAQVKADLRSMHDSLRNLSDIRCPIPGTAGATTQFPLRDQGAPVPAGDGLYAHRDTAPDLTKDAPEPVSPQPLDEQALLQKAVKVATQAAKTVTEHALAAKDQAFQEEMTKQADAHKAEVTKLEERIEELAKQPDPSKGPALRHGLPPGAPYRIIQDEGVNAPDNADAGLVEVYKGLAASSSDYGLRMQARKWLEEHGIDPNERAPQPAVR